MLPASLIFTAMPAANKDASRHAFDVAACYARRFRRYRTTMMFSLTLLIRAYH